jgi:acetyl esterase/lipase
MKDLNIGSGFILPVFGESRPFIEYLLQHETLASYPLAIFDCDYAKAPEHPCPASTDDARDVLNYVFQHSQIYDMQRVTIGGFSAGACIALGISAEVGSEVRQSTWKHPLPESSGHSIGAVIAVYPLTTPGKVRPAPPIPGGTKYPGLVLTKKIVDVFDAAYFFPPSHISPSSPVDTQRVKALQQQPLISPGEADPKDISETVVLITAEYDTLAQEGEELRQKLKTAPGKMIYGWSTPKAAHNWDLVVLPGDYGFEERVQAYDLAAKVIARVGGVQVDI